MIWRRRRGSNPQDLAVDGLASRSVTITVRLLYNFFCRFSLDNVTQNTVAKATVFLFAAQAMPVRATNPPIRLTSHELHPLLVKVFLRKTYHFSGKMVGVERFELSTPALSEQCSNQLSYTPVIFF